MNDDIQPDDFDLHELRQRMEEHYRAQLQQAEGDVHQILLDTGCGVEALYCAHVGALTMHPEGTVNELILGPVTARCDWLVHVLQRFHAPGEFSEDASGSVAASSLEAVLSASQRALDSASFVVMEEASGLVDELDLKIALAGLANQMQIVRGSAYPDQLSERVVSVMSKFDSWFMSTMGCTPAMLVDAMWAVVRTLEHRASAQLPIGELIEASEAYTAARARKRRKKASDEDLALLRRFPKKTAYLAHCALRLQGNWMPANIPMSREKVLPDPVAEDTWQALMSLLAVRLDRNAEPVPSPFLFQPAPAIRLGDDQLVLHDFTNSLDLLFDRLEASLRQSNRKDRYDKWLGRWVADKAVDYLRRVFGPDHVWASLDYPDPDKPAESGATAELDALAHWGGWIFLIEVKARRHFRVADGLTPGRVRSDIKRNIESADEQARRAERCLASGPSVTFVERGTGREFSTATKQVEGVLRVTVTLHQLDGLAFSLGESRSLGLFEHSEYPWSISLAELDVITSHAEGPDILIDYARRRHALYHAETKLMVDELGLFGAYLDSRLRGQAFDQPAATLSLGTFHLRFDEWAEHRRGDRPDAPRISLRVPPWISAVLSDLRGRHGDPQAQNLCLRILDLPSPALDLLGQERPKAITRQPVGVGISRFEATHEDLAILVVVGPPQDREAWAKELLKRLMVVKYRGRKTKAIGFGVLRGDTRPVSTVTWLEHEWARNEDLDALTAAEPPLLMHRKKPGRNDPCPCDSGKKFKKCCIDRYK